MGLINRNGNPIILENKILWQGSETPNWSNFEKDLSEDIGNFRMLVITIAHAGVEINLILPVLNKLLTPVSTAYFNENDKCPYYISCYIDPATIGKHIKMKIYAWKNINSNGGVHFKKIIGIR